MDVVARTRADAQAIASGMAANDQLALFAANNLVIGSPFPDGGDPRIGTDIKYFNQVELSHYGAELAQEKATGYMLDRIPVTPMKMCYLRPWDTLDKCIYSDAPDFATRVQTTTMPVTTHPADYVNDVDYYYASQSFQLYSAYTDNFLPKNMAGGVLVDWINRTQFDTLTANVAERTTAALPTSATTGLPDAFGRRRRMKNISFPITSSSGHPLDVSTWDADLLLDQMETLTGLSSQTAGLYAYNGDPTVTPAAATFAARFKQFINTCRQGANGTLPGNPNAIDYGFGGRTKDTFSLSTGWSFLGTPGYVCQFFFRADPPTLADPTVFPGGVVPPGDARMEIVYDNWQFACTDLRHQHLDVLNLPTEEPRDPARYHGPNASPASYCFRKADGSDPPATMSNRPDSLQADFYVAIQVTGGPGTLLPRVAVGTRFWDPVKIPAHNRIDKIQAMLFANQFLVGFQDTFADRQLRIDGGIVAKDIGGRFINKSGWERSYAAGGYPTAGMWHDGTHGSSPSLMVRHDPRFQFDTELLYQDLLSVDY
jgi:hypothetical protein